MRLRRLGLHVLLLPAAAILLVSLSGAAAEAQGATCNGELVTIDMNTGAPGLGTAGPDVILGTPGDDTIYALDGDDIVCGGDGRDRIYGGANNDRLFGNDGVDYIWGGGEDDTIEGNGGSDRLRGGHGYDTILGGSGADHMWGGLGDDVMRGQGGQDRMWGGHGADTMQGNWQSDIIWGGNGDDTVGGAEGKDVLHGGFGNDRLTGGSNTDTLFGGSGGDVIAGGKGTDTLSGGAGIDTLHGGPHTDICHRGSGDTLNSCQTSYWERSDRWKVAPPYVSSVTAVIIDSSTSTGLWLCWSRHPFALAFNDGGDASAHVKPCGVRINGSVTQGAVYDVSISESTLSFSDRPELSIEFVRDDAGEQLLAARRAWDAAIADNRDSYEFEIADTGCRGLGCLTVNTSVIGGVATSFGSADGDPVEPVAPLTVPDLFDIIEGALNDDELHVAAWYGPFGVPERYEIRRVLNTQQVGNYWTPFYRGGEVRGFEFAAS